MEKFKINCKDCGAEKEVSKQVISQIRTGRKVGLCPQCTKKRWIDSPNRTVFQIGHTINKYHTKETKRESERIKQLKWREKNREKDNNYKRNYYHSHLEKSRMTCRISANKRRTSGDINFETIKQIISNQKLEEEIFCYICNGNCTKKWEIDHVIPVTSGGTNDVANLKIICPPCNRRKYNKSLQKFIEDKGNLILKFSN